MPHAPNEVTVRNAIGLIAESLPGEIAGGLALDQAQWPLAADLIIGVGREERNIAVSMEPRLMNHAPREPPVASGDIDLEVLAVDHRLSRFVRRLEPGLFEVNPQLGLIRMDPGDCGDVRAAQIRRAVLQPFR